MKKSDFCFDLPEELIAQTPLGSRDASRLLCVNRGSGGLMHRHFYDLPELLAAGDLLVLNDSRVLPARLTGRRGTGGAAEVLLLKEAGRNKRGSPSASIDPGKTGGAENPGAAAGIPRTRWECMVRPGSKIKAGVRLIFGSGELTATVIDVLPDGNRIIEFEHSGDFTDILNKLGKMPLPPYIHKELTDSGRYQTVYSAAIGSAAAPTAGLHFTGSLLAALAAKGIETAYVTLHIGPGTFRPVKCENIEDHVMHREEYEISPDAAGQVSRAKEDGRRVIAVGTTACRTLESAADETGRIMPSKGETGIFIYPGYRFRCIDGLITNFHLPGSTLIMLVAAFAGTGRIMAAYKEAIAERYRFYSFGDAMLIM